jgi:hypothetical protein
MYLDSEWQMDGGKGSKPRPIPDRKKFDENWEKIFGKKKKDDKRD